MMIAGIDPAALLPFVAVGFAAQVVDGAMGMAFGLISNTMLIWIGVPPAAASAGVHGAETVTTAASGISHLVQGNIDRRLFVRVALPGIVGGALGAFVLSGIDGNVAKPFILAYLGIAGLYLLWRARGPAAPRRAPRLVEPLGLVGGFLDAVGGGGWGPVVTSNLLVQGAEPRTTIGSVNAAEFFVAATISATFLARLGFAAFTVEILGLLIGGVLAAPIGAMLARRVPAQRLLLLVGAVLTLTSIVGVWRAITH